MIYTAVFLFAAGIFMILTPGFFWRFTEKWKSSGAVEPSALYLVSIRLGGGLCLLAGIAAAVAYFL